MSSDPLVVLGGGYIGSRLVRAGLAAGRKVRLCSRSVAKLEPLRALGADVHYLDAGKPKQFGPALVGASGATIVYGIPPVTELPAGEAVRRAGQAAVNAGAKRFIFLSSSGLYGMKPADDEIIDENRSIALDDPGMVHLHAEESAVQALGATGLPTTTLRLGVVYGPGRGVRARLRKGDYQLVDDGAHWITRIHVDDLVRIVFALEKRGTPGAMYLVGDDKPTRQREVAEWLCQRMGLELPRSVPLFGAGAAARTHRGRRLSNAKLKADLGLDLLYPTYVEGEAAIEKEEGGDAPVVPAPAPAPAPSVPRPPNIVRLADVPTSPDYVRLGESFPNGDEIGEAVGLTHLGISFVRLAPGQRSSLPHAHSQEDEYFHVIEGTPDLWQDGVLHRLSPGDAVGFPAGTGIAHTVVNQTDRPVLLFVVGERMRAGDQLRYPMNPEWEAQLRPGRLWPS
jgi:uncharacterized cupin superfamily protein/nucleoside-diphosphate-sugar epimerase